MDTAEKLPSVLMTGYRGFSGKYLTAVMRERGYVVHGLVRNEAVAQHEHLCDLSDRANLTQLISKIKPDYVIHLAAISFVAHGCINDFYQTNVIGTVNLLEAIQQSGVQLKKVIIASSANIYGNPGLNFISEETAPQPMNHYANSKMAMENVAKLYFDQFPIIITRPFNYTGFGQSESFLVPKIAAHFRNRLPTIKLGNLDVIRDISDINFLVESYMRLLSSAVHSEIFNICSGVGYSLLEIIEMFEKISEYKIKIDVDPGLVRANEIKKLIGCNKKLVSVVGNIQGSNMMTLLKSMLL